MELSTKTTNKLITKTTKLLNRVFGEYSSITMFKFDTVIKELTKSVATGLYPKPYNNFTETELKEILRELKICYFFNEESLKISRDDFAKMEDWEKAKFINKIYFEYTQTKCIYRENDNCFYDIDSESIIDNLYDYALALNDEYTDVHNRLFK